MPPRNPDRRRIWFDRLGKFVRDFMFGAAYSWLSTMRTVRQRGVVERIFALNMACEFVGLPLLPGQCVLRLLPYVTPQILTWRRARYLWSDELEAAARHIHH